jgi:hypothetical protein
MAGSPRLAAIRRMACPEEAQGSSPPSRACRAASRLMTAGGWPVLMLVLAVMVRRKASRCRKCPRLMISPGGGGAGGNAVGGVQELAGQFLDAGGGGVHGDASRGTGRRAGAPGGWTAWRGGLLPVTREGPGAAGRSIGGQHAGAAAE